MIVVVDNTQDFSQAYMTPKLVDFLEKNQFEYILLDGSSALSDNLEIKSIKAVILSGGPLNLTSGIKLEKIKPNIELILRLFLQNTQIPILGICFGFQLLALIFGGKLGRLSVPEKGESIVKIVNNSPLFKGFTEKVTVFNNHEDFVNQIPENFSISAKGLKGQIQAMQHNNLPIFGVQFHPEGLESTHQILTNFLELAKSNSS